MAKAYKAYHDLPYLGLVKDVLYSGKVKQNRTGDPARAVFGREMRFDLSDNTVPLLTSKEMFTRGTIVELLDFFIPGTSSIRPLQAQRVNIWNEWADENGDLGPVYGVQWRRWKKYVELPRLDASAPGYLVEEIDQLQQLINTLKTNPLDRRMIVSAWNVAELPEMALMPCHYLFQCYVEENEDPNGPQYRLSMKLSQRSADVGLGVPFNIVQYSMLLRMIAHVVGMAPGEFIWSGGDVHIYEKHVEGLMGQLENPTPPSPTLRFARPIDNIDDFKLEDFIIEGYRPGPKIVLEVSV